MKRRLCIILAAGLMLAGGCTEYTAAPAEIAAVSTAAQAQPLPAATAAPTAMPTPMPASTPVPTPEPPAVATVGFVGDILMMTSQIDNAELEGGGYDFSASFEPMRGLFEGVDIMCANFECTLAGEEAGYTQPRPDPPAPTAEEPNPKAPFQTFNAPDELAKNLFDAGLDVMTTANNHCLDRDEEGLYRTAETLRAAGLRSTGTFLSREDRDTPLVLETNGIAVGIVAAASNVNRRDGKLSDEAREYAVCRLDEEDKLAADIAKCRAYGAEFIIVCPHWGSEYENRNSSRQEKTAQELIAMGADAVIGSHPHVVQPIEWVSAERDGQMISVPVVYSLGNFISNMSPSPRDYGLFVRLTLTREEPSAPITAALEYLPTVCIRRKEDGRTLHQVLPCYQDTALICAPVPLDEDEMEKTAKARAHVMKIAGEEFAPLG